ncbi:MAG: 7-cyano-7-deazaguanine synthase QueC [Gammaproteobacteria bacterium]|nr:7-cyano-7-deazaguanine synthase QueC [Gammaproteobacteria bacterium]
MKKKAVILLSGGLDSATCLAIAQSQGYDCYALSFEYGQKQVAELNAAKQLAKKLGALEHKIVNVGLNSLGGSALTDPKMSIPDYQADTQIPITYVPARNTVFIAIALGWAEVLGAYDIFVGANAVDYSGYPDCRPDYYAAFSTLANLATKAGREGHCFTIHTPLIQLHKSEIIREGLKLGVDYALTVSCYRADEEGKACGKCDSCTFRREGFLQMGVNDPTRYQL